MKLLEIVLVVLAVLLIVEKVGRFILVLRFFRRPQPDAETAPRLVSILQPVMGGDPTLTACLEESLQARTRFSVEFWYLLDVGDTEALRTCQYLHARYGKRVAGMLLLPPPPDGISPKLFKLAAGQKVSRGDVVCCLDDDTVLPDDALETVLPYLSLPDVGLAFGLPYYKHFGNLWSAYVSCFVNASSLLTYIPYTALCDPFTINGMFYAVRRETLEAVGGFEAAQEIIADDFGMAHLFRSSGYKLAQTPVRHGIYTHVRDLGHLTGLLKRWFTFPRESLLRHLTAFERGVVLTVGVTANLLPVVLLIGTLVVHTAATLAFTSFFFVVALAIIAYLNRAYLNNATPVGARLLLTPLVLVAFPLQMMVALLSPRQRVNWRGNLMEAQKGGGFRFVKRHDEK